MDEQMIALFEQYGVVTLQYTLDVVGALVLLVLGWVVAGWLRRVVRRALSSLRGADATMTGFISNLTRYIVLILVLIAVLAQFGVQTASILAVLGTIGLAIGLALQGTLSNIAAGVMLLLLRPFKVGDYIDAEGVSGTVDEVGLFSTQMTTFDGIYLAVPNSQIWTRAIKNYSRLPTRRMDIVIGIAYEDDMDTALAALMGLMQGDDRVLRDPEPQVMIASLGDSAVNLNMRCWTSIDDYWSLYWDFNKAARERVEAAGCSIPFPQRDLHIVSGGGAPLSGIEVKAGAA